ncbi:hypothetical protein DXG01_001313 [Tephrocybe rancida]|nr:hypothetical protein DXG01_001313 [Tephrocybe rancida]
MASKDTPRKARSAPGTSAGLTQYQTRQMLRDSIDNHLIQCTVEVWFQTYAVTLPNGRRFGTSETSSFVEDVKAAIDRSILDESGWKAMQAAKGDSATEAVIYGNLVNIAIVVGKAAKQVDPTIAVSNELKESGSQTTIHETPSFFFRTDFRLLPDEPNLAAFLYGSVVTEALTVIYVKRESLRAATQENTATSKRQQLMRLAAASGVIGEVKRNSGVGPKQDVRVTLSPHRQVAWLIAIDMGQNESKTISAATAIMYNDPRRRHIYAFTAEDSKFRFWIFNRGHVCCSEPFDIHEKPNYLIQFLLFIITADATQLGYDPTVKRREVSSPDSPAPVIAYEYEVEGRRYLTEGGPISETAAYHITSRATRVWLVREICSRPKDGELYLSSDCFVLKDAWLYSDAKLESEIQKDIFDKLGKTLADAARPYFMTLLKDWRVEFGGNRDLSFELPLEYDDGSLTQPVPTLAAQHALCSQQSTSSTRDSNKHARPPPKSKEKLQHHRRQHVRTVCEEVCWSMYEVEDFAELLQTLNDNVQALWYMRQAGYVHRDVSAGNCLWNIKGKHGILSDLEYARPYREIIGHDPKTGTPAFMAVEYQRDKHLFLPTESSTKLDPMQPPTGRQKTGPQDCKLAYNYYHDLESVYWVYLWFLHRCVPREFYNRQSDFSLLHQKAQDLFDCDVSGNAARLEIFTIANYGVLSWVEIVWPFYGGEPNPQLFHLVGHITLFHDLISAYTALEATEVKEQDAVETREGEEQKGKAQDMGKEVEKKRGKDRLPFFWDEERFVKRPYEIIMERFQASIKEIGCGGRVPMVWLNKELPPKRGRKLEDADSGGRQGKKSRES